jgi:hypothetical protein
VAKVPDGRRIQVWLSAAQFCVNGSVGLCFGRMLSVSDGDSRSVLAFMLVLLLGSAIAVQVAAIKLGRYIAYQQFLSDLESLPIVVLRPSPAQSDDTRSVSGAPSSLN